jgi:hypothetical protein
LNETEIQRKHSIASRMSNALEANTPLMLRINHTGAWERIRNTVRRVDR